MRVRLLLCLLLSLAFVETATHAELPPYVYKQRQDAAPEAVKIKVETIEKKVSETKDSIATHLVAQAKIQEVTRTASGLKPGSLITIIYTHIENRVPIAGPSAIPQVREGLEYTAYLSKESGSKFYIPVAGGRSFE